MRAPAVAGLFYPSDPAALRAEVTALLDEVPAVVAPSRLAAVLAPHAGYRYSGAVAAHAFRAVEAGVRVCRRVVVIGPSHHLAFDGLALPAADRFATPLGTLPIDLEMAEGLRAHRAVSVDDAAHGREHAIEVELPFLQHVLGAVPLVPLVVGRASARTVAEVLEMVTAEAGTLLVVSSDLSHFLGWGEARVVDEATARTIETLAGPLAPEQACGAMAWNGFAPLARRRGWRARRLDLRNSGDTAGDRQRVVGYGAFAFDDPEEGGPDG